MRPPSLLLFSALVVFFAIPAFAQTNLSAKADAGELELYEHSTQIGTIARRTFRDETGRTYKTIYYTSRNFERGGKSLAEKDLIVQSTQLFHFRPDGLPEKLEFRGPTNQLNGTKYFEYNSDQQHIRTWSTRPNGIKVSESYYDGSNHNDKFYTGSRRVTDLQFDDTGSRVITIRGRVRNDPDLPDGWGESAKDLAVGIVLSKTIGALEDIEIWLNIRNTGVQRINIMELPDATIVLRDARNEIISESSEYLQSKKPHSQLYGQSLLAGEAGHLYPAYPLKARFPNLSPGRYTLRLIQPVRETDVRLESNPVTFVIQ